MLRLEGKRIYLSALEREDCRKLWDDFEYDFANPCEPLMLGGSIVKADEWFEEINKRQHTENIRLGIFLPSGEVIGDIALQGLDHTNRSCSVGAGIARIANRAKGYGFEALRLILQYGFRHIGLERISASTLEHNHGAQKSLERAGFVLEGRERQAVYLNARRYDRLLYAILKDEFACANDGEGANQ